MKEYIAEDNEEMAVKTIQEIYARIENMQQLPYMGDLAKRYFKLNGRNDGITSKSKIKMPTFVPEVGYKYVIWELCCAV